MALTDDELTTSQLGRGPLLMSTASVYGPTLYPSRTTYVEEVLADTPAAFWRMGDHDPFAAVGTGVLEDYGPGGLDAVWTTPATPEAVGALIGDGDGAVRFIAAFAQYAQRAADAAFNILAATSLTLECWVRFTALPGTGYVLVKRQTSVGNSPYYQLTIDTAGKPRFFVRGATSGEGGVTGPSAINDGGWHHVVGVRDAPADLLMLYVDGELVAVGTDPSVGDLATTNPVWIGTHGTSAVIAGQYLDGSIDEVAIYRTALRSDRIEAHRRAALHYVESLFEPLIVTEPTFAIAQQGEFGGVQRADSISFSFGNLDGRANAWMRSDDPREATVVAHLYDAFTGELSRDAFVGELSVFKNDLHVTSVTATSVIGPYTKTWPTTKVSASDFARLPRDGDGGKVLAAVIGIAERVPLRYVGERVVESDPNHYDYAADGNLAIVRVWQGSRPVLDRQFYQRLRREYRPGGRYCTVVRFNRRQANSPSPGDLVPVTADVIRMPDMDDRVLLEYQWQGEFEDATGGGRDAMPKTSGGVTLSSLVVGHTAYGAPETLPSGYGLGAVRIANATDYLTADPTGLDNQSFTIEAWVNLNTVPGVIGYVLQGPYGNISGDEAEVRGWFLRVLNTGELSFMFARVDKSGADAGIPDLVSDGSAGFTTSRWFYVAVTRDRASGRTVLYVNGVAEVASIVDDDIDYGLTMLTPVVIGTSASVSAGTVSFTSNFFNGSVGWTRLSSGARTPAEIYDNWLLMRRSPLWLAQRVLADVGDETNAGALQVAAEEILAVFQQYGLRCDGAVTEETQILAVLEQLGAFRGLRFSRDRDSRVVPEVTRRALLRYEDVVLADRPVGYWRLNEDSPMVTVARDSSGHHYDGYSVAEGGQTVGGVGPIADGTLSWQFDGSTNGISVGDVPAFDFDDETGFTAEFWIKTSSSGTARTIVRKLNDVDGNGWAIKRTATDQIGIYLFGHVTASVAAGPTGWSNNAWHHGVVAVDGRGFAIYRDGALIFARRWAEINVEWRGFHKPSRTDLLIGCDPSMAEVFLGSIDEVALYDGVMAGDRVAAHYEAASQAGTQYIEADLGIDARVSNLSLPFARGRASAPEASQDLSLAYRPSRDEAGTLTGFQADATIDIQDTGQETAPVPLSFVWDHRTADIVLTFEAPRRANRDRAAEIVLGHLGRRLKIGSLVQLSAPAHELDAEVNEVLAINASVRQRNLRVCPYDETALTYLRPNYEDVVLAQLPAGYWRLGELGDTFRFPPLEAQDISGNGFDGTYAGGVLLGRPGGLLGDLDTCALGDGVLTIASMGDVLERTGTSSFSLSAWVFPTEIVTGGRVIGRVGILSGSFQGYNLYVSSSLAQITRHLNGTANVASAAITANVWTHLVGTYDGTNLRLYVNGVLVDTEPSSLSLLTLGASWPFFVGSAFPGRVDEAAIWFRPLTADEVAEQYAAGATRSPRFFPRDLGYNDDDLALNVGTSPRIVVNGQAGTSPGATNGAGKQAKIDVEFLSTEILDPVAYGDLNQWDTLVGADRLAALATDDSDTTYVKHVPRVDGYTYELYRVPSPTKLLSRVRYIKVAGRLRLEALGKHACFFAIKTGGKVWLSTIKLVSTTSYADYSHTWDKNPATGVGWEFHELQDLQVGIAIGASATGNIRMTRLYGEYATIADAPIDLSIHKVWRVGPSATQPDPPAHTDEPIIVGLTLTGNYDVDTLAAGTYWYWDAAFDAMGRARPLIGPTKMVQS